jgi:hypothetical protein
MEYIGRVPAPPLDLFIDDIYCVSGDNPVTEDSGCT